MDGYSVKSLGLLPTLVVSSLLFLAVGFTANVHATSTQQQSAPGVTNNLQLAYYYVHGYWGPGYRHYWGPGYYHRRGVYWTGWRPYYYRHGVRCQRSCLVNRWNGAIIRCAKRCY